MFSFSPFHAAILFACSLCAPTTTDEIIEVLAKETFFDNFLGEEIPTEDFKTVMSFILSNETIAQRCLENSVEFIRIFKKNLNIVLRDITYSYFTTNICMAVQMTAAPDYIRVLNPLLFKYSITHHDRFIGIVLMDLPDREGTMKLVEEKGFIPGRVLIVDSERKVTIKEELREDEPLDEWACGVIEFKRK